MTIFRMAFYRECANSLMNTSEVEEAHMFQSSRPEFPHRRKPNGTFDSICTRCFLTIGNADTEAELRAAERVHDCKGFDLCQIMNDTEHLRRRSYSE